MCKYKFLEHPNAKCKFHELLNIEPNDSKLHADLPFDNMGICLFHSKDNDFKNSHPYHSILEKLIQIVIKNDKALKFIEVDFGNLGLDLKDITFTHFLTFKHCKFPKGLSFENVSFNESILEIYDCKIDKKLEVINCEIDTINLFSSKVKEVVVIGTNFGGGSALFHNNTFFEDFKISNSYFDNALSFRGSQFLTDAEGYYGEIKNFSFKDSTCQGAVEFTDVQFNGSVYLEELKLKFGAKFIDTHFSYNRPLFIENIKIGKKGILQFRAFNEKARLFNSEVQIKINEVDIEGKIQFENVNFNNIAQHDKLILLELNKKGKVDIGKGCIKYRHQTEKIKIELDEHNHKLALELAQTFIGFFKISTNNNIGVEIVERTESYLQLFYFTDADISYKEFIDSLSDCENKIWKIIKVEKQAISSNHHQLSKIDKLLIASDTIINLTSIILKIASRIPLGKISKTELVSLFNTISFNENSSIPLEGITTLNINQNIIFGMNNSQTVKSVRND